MNRIESKYSKTMTTWTIANLLVFFMTLAVNYLGATGFFNGMDQSDISSKYRTLITPSGFAFSIWSVIYILVFATLVYLFIKRKDPRVIKLTQLISGLFIVSSVFNMGWIVAFSYELVGLSTLFIIGILLSLMAIIHRIYTHQAQVPSTLAVTAFTLYASWVFIATILNSAIVAVQQGWGGFGISGSVWTIIVLLMAIAFITGYVMRYKNALFALAPAWAYFGIYSAYSNGTHTPSMASTIQIVLMFGIAVFIALIGYTFYKNKYAVLSPAN